MDAGIFKGRERMILALLLGMAFMVFQIFFPNLEVTEMQFMAFFGLLGAYIVGEGISSQAIGEGLSDLVKSQKFQALAAGLILILIKGFYPEFALSEEQLLSAIALFGSFIVGAGVRS